MATLDAPIWSDTRGAVEHLLGALDRGDHTFLYFPFHDWMREPPTLPSRVADALTVVRGKQSLAQFDVVAEALPELLRPLQPRFADVSDESWVGVLAYLPLDPAPRAFVVAHTWPIDPRLAFLRHHSWIDRQSNGIGPDLMMQLGMHARIVHEFVSAGHLGLVTSSDSAAFRAWLTKRFDWYVLARDALSAHGFVSAASAG